MGPPDDLNGYNPTIHDGSYYYDEAAAEKAIAFFEELLTHTKGRKARTPLLLEEWQKDFLKTLYGWKCIDSGYRRYLTAVYSAGRGNGKTTIAAGVAVKQLGFDREHGAECYIAAPIKDVAVKTYEVATAMIRQSKLRSRFTILDSRSRILYPKRNSYLQCLAHNAGNANSFNAHYTCADELHEWIGQKGREFFETLESGHGKRSQPLMFITSTAGSDRTSIFYDVWKLCQRVIENPAVDYTLLPLIYACDPLEPGFDPYDEKQWYKANPNLGEGKGVEIKYLRKQAAQAKAIPSKENEFLRKHLNIWTETSDKFLSGRDLELCPHDEIPDDVLKREYAVGAIDTSSTKDLSAVGLYWPKLKYFRVWSFIPGVSARQRSLLDGIDYEAWRKKPSSNLVFAGEKRIQRSQLFEKIMELHKTYKVLGWAYDPWEQKIGIVDDLSKKGLRVIEFNQGYASYNAPTKEFEMLVVNHQFNWGQNKIFEWACGNLSVKEHQGLVRPVKPEEQAKRIDPVITAIMAIGISKSVSPVGIST